MKNKILIVDNDSYTASSIKDGLNILDINYEVLGADSGEKCFELLKNHGIPDIILLEIMMPGMSGWEVFERLKENQL